jgi:hypothetical protein
MEGLFIIAVNGFMIAAALVLAYEPKDYRKTAWSISMKRVLDNSKKQC